MHPPTTWKLSLESFSSSIIVQFSCGRLFSGNELRIRKRPHSCRSKYRQTSGSCGLAWPYSTPPESWRIRLQSAVSKVSTQPDTAQGESKCYRLSYCSTDFEYQDNCQNGYKYGNGNQEHHRSAEQRRPLLLWLSNNGRRCVIPFADERQVL